MVDLYGMEVFKTVKRFGIIGIAFCIVQMNLLGVPQFTLPAGIPGVTIGMPPTGSRTNCVCEIGRAHV